LIQADYKPNKLLEIYSRYHRGTRSINSSEASAVLPGLALQASRDWRAQVNFRINTTITLRNRTELIWVGTGEPEQGFLTSFDIIYKPSLKSYFRKPADAIL